MKKTIKYNVMLAMIAALSSANAMASVNVNTFSPASGSKYKYSENGMPEIPDAENIEDLRRYYFGFHYGFINTPLVALDQFRSERTDTLVEAMHTIDILGGMEWNGKFSLNVGIPLHLVKRPDRAEEFSFGDARIFGKYYFTNRRSFLNVALIPTVWLSSGDKELFTTDSSPGFGAALAFEYDFGAVAFAANVGYRYTRDALFEAIDYRQRLPMSLSLHIPVATDWAVNLEGATQIPLPVNRFQNPSDIYAGLQYRMNQEFLLSAGAGLGSVNGIASADWTAIAGLRFAPVTWEVAKPAPQPTIPRVVMKPDKIEIREEIKFEHNSDVLSPSSSSLLDEIAEVIKKDGKTLKKVVVEGHANELGSDDYNLKLSRQRALSVADYLQSRGVPAATLGFSGYGEQRPKVVGTQLSLESRLAINRRVEFRVVR